MPAATIAKQQGPLHPTRGAHRKLNVNEDQLVLWYKADKSLTFLLLQLLDVCGERGRRSHYFLTKILVLAGSNSKSK
jgi:hypothetical protein